MLVASSTVSETLAVTYELYIKPCIVADFNATIINSDKDILLS